MFLSPVCFKANKGRHFVAIIKGVVHRGDTVVEHTGRTVDYSYDDTYKLTSEIISDPVFGSKTISYTYDAVGNRLSKTEDGSTIKYVYDDNDRLLSETSASGNTTYLYDDNGNTLSKISPTENISYGYDYNNRLIQVDDGSTIVEYKYDTDGMRVQKKINNEVVHFLVDKNRDYSQVLRETDSSGQIIVDYVYGDDLISQKRSSLKSFYHYDGQLSTRQLTDASQTVTDEYNYDAFGLLLARSGSTVNNYMYTGEQYDPNVGFYYLRARYYNPTNGRFITMDTWPGMQFEPMSLHKYLYCESGPVGKWDPSGKMTFVEIVTVVAAIGVLLAGCFAIGHHLISWAKSLVVWEGYLEIKYFGHRVGVAIMTGSLRGIHEVENETYRGKGTYTIVMEGVGSLIPTYTKSYYTFYTPGIYGANPVTLTGSVGLGNISTFNPLWSVLGLTTHSPLEGEYVVGAYMGKGWAFGGGIYEGWDFGLDLMTGVSTMNSGKGPY